MAGLSLPAAPRTHLPVIHEPKPLRGGFEMALGGVDVLHAKLLRGAAGAGQCLHLGQLGMFVPRASVTPLRTTTGGVATAKL